MCERLVAGLRAVACQLPINQSLTRGTTRQSSSTDSAADFKDMSSSRRQGTKDIADRFIN